jgi:hypothetical protein
MEASRGGFLSKASSSLRRSPSKRHKSQTSNPLPPLDQVFYDTQKGGATSTNHTLSQTRPDVYRTPTAPSASQPARASLKEDKTAQSASDGNMLAASSSFASNDRRDASAALNSNAIAMAKIAERMHFAGVLGEASLPAPVIALGGSDVLYHHIHDMASKRISTLDYFRKAYV